MTIRYITSYKGGAGKSHVAVLMGQRYLTSCCDLTNSRSN